MLDVLAQVLAVPGLGWVVVVAVMAGLVHGFAGFGAALIFMPMASRFLPVETAVAAFSISNIASVFTLMPGAWRVAERRTVMWMIAAACVTASLGLWVLRSTDLTLMRWAVLFVCSLTLVALMGGWRVRTEPSFAARGFVGGAAGFLGGATGLNGPVMILFQLARADTIAVSRANTLLFLTLTSACLLPLMVLQNMLPLSSIVLGLVLLVPYGIGTRLGAAVFDPSREAFYRSTAYAIIALAIVLGLPIWG
ncbi:MAG: TSUP family transporter [Marinovum sp.]|nr:TSUP family transporter [Marinovum sp.]